VAGIALSRLSFEAGERGQRIAAHPTFPAAEATERLEPWDGFERQMTYRSAYDGTGEPENYGIHSAELVLILKGEHGAIEGGVITGWHMPHVLDRIAVKERAWLLKHPGTPLLSGLSGLHVGHHSPRPPRYWAGYDDDDVHGEGPISTECPLTGGDCYFDSSGLAGENFAVALAGEGWQAAWNMLASWYDHTFLESDGTHYHGRIYTGWNSPTQDRPLWSEYTTGHRELERERRLKEKEKR